VLEKRAALGAAEEVVESPAVGSTLKTASAVRKVVLAREEPTLGSSATL
jgi:hypothetical protein